MVLRSDMPNTNYKWKTFHILLFTMDVLFVPSNNFTIKCCLQIANSKAKVNFVVSFDIKDNSQNIGLF